MTSTILTIALTLFGEAAGEGVAGMEAVASVIVRRAEQRNMSYEAVCKARRQFSCWNDGRTPVVPDDFKSRVAYRSAVMIAERMVEGRFIPTLDANHYHAAYVSPKWAIGQTPVARIGVHVFYRI